MKVKVLISKISVIMLALSILLGNFGVLPQVSAASQPIPDIPDWSTSYNNNNVDGEAYIDQEEAFAGSGSLKIVNRTPKTSNVFLAIRQNVAVKPSTTYQVNLQVKAQEAARISAVLNSDWTARKALPEGTYDWQQVSFTITTDSSTTTFPFTILSDGLTEAVWIDDIIMIESGTSENLIKNGDFETVVPVANVVADIAQGAVEQGTLVSLSTPTAAASVYYTLDQTDPVTSPTRQWYEQPISIDHPLVIKAYATKTGLAASPVSTFHYSLDMGEGVSHIEQVDFFSNLAAGKSIPVYYKDDFAIDGSLSDWEQKGYLELPLVNGALPSNLSDWEGEQDLSAKIRFAYDENNLYMGAQIKDNVHHALAGTSMWSADSIQFATGTGALFGPEYGFAHADGQAEVWSWSSGTAVLDKDAVQLSTNRVADTTIYEAAIPWKALQKEKPEKILPFNILINDNDEAGRKSWVEWTPGIGKYKDQYAFGNLFLVPQHTEWFAWLDRDYEFAEENRAISEKGQAVDFSLYVMNPYPEDREFQISIPGLNESWNPVIVPAHTVWRKQLQAAFAETGAQKLTAEVTELSGAISQFPEWSIQVIANGDELAAELDRLALALPALKALRDTALAQGLPMDYDNVDIAVIERFIPYGKEDVQKGLLDQAQYVVEELSRLYRETKNRLEAYLAGDSAPLAAPRYVTGPIQLDGYSFVGQTVDAQGELQTGPVFFTGYGHFQQVRKDVASMSSFGANMIQIETGPNRVLLAPDSPVGWSKGIWGNADVTFGYDTGSVQEGSRSFKLTNQTPKSPNVYGTIWQRVAIKPNTEYTIRLWIKGENVNNAWFGTFESRKAIPAGTYDWQQITHTYRSGNAETAIDLRILTENVTDALYIDNISMEEQGTSLNLVAYPGFEDEHTTIKEDYLISEASVRNDIQKVLQDAADHNQAVSLLLSPHYFPAFLLEKYPDMKSNNTGFIKYNINHPKAREAVEDFLRTVIPLVKDYPSLNNLVLSNEPVFMSYKDPAFTAEWQRYLEERHGDIALLNAAYGTSYTAFDQVALPAAEERSPLYYDWINFNDQLFGEWHQWMADLIHEMAPDIPVNVKIMAGALSREQLAKSPLSWGVDPEQISGLSQLNGLDAWNFLHSEGATIMEKLKFYDLLASFKEAPLINSEDHIIPDKDTRFVPEQVSHVRNDIWQGAVHGRSASVVWVWERTDDAASDLAGSVLNRPDVVSAIGKTSLDLNRLANQVTAFQQAPYETAILYAKASSMYRPAYLDAVDRAYAALSYSGQKAGFISEKQVQAGGLSGLKLLVVPDSRYVDAETLDHIQAYLNQGGTVFVMGEQALQFDIYQRNLDAQVRNDILARSTVIPVAGTASAMQSPSAGELKEQLLPVLARLDLLQSEIVDEATGQPVMDVEWRLVEHEGRLLLNVSNYSWNTRTVQIRLHGRQVQSAYDLIGAKPISVSGLELAPYSPLLLDIGKAGGEPGEQPNSPSALTSTFSADTTRIAADGRSGSEIVVHLKDQEGLPVTDGAHYIELTASLGKLGDLTEGDEGTYKATLTSAEAGTATVKAIINGVPLEDELKIEFYKPASGSGSGYIPPENSLETGNVSLLAGQAGEVGLKGQILLSIPAGAVKSFTRISIREVEEPVAAAPGRKLSPVFELVALPDLALDQPAILTLAYDDSGLKGERAAIFYYDESAATWIELQGKDDNKALIAELGRLGKIAAFAVPARPEEPGAGNAAEFKDIAGHWAEAMIKEAVGLGLAQGYEDGTFRPDRGVTREEFAVLADRWFLSRGENGLQRKELGSLPDYGERTPFRDDASISGWAKQAVADAAKAGWLKGYQDGAFRPKQEVTRAELAVMMQRILGLPAVNLDLARFADHEDIPEWGAEAAAAAVQAGLFQGDEKGRFLPSASATRAETIALLMRVAERFE